MNDSQKKRLENVWEALKHDKIAIFSIAFLAIILILSLLAPVLPLEPNKTDVAHMLEAPSSAHIFGTDEVGRDYLARVIYGGRISLLVGVATCTQLLAGRLLNVGTPLQKYVSIAPSI